MCMDPEQARSHSSPLGPRDVKGPVEQGQRADQEERGLEEIRSGNEARSAGWGKWIAVDWGLRRSGRARGKGTRRVEKRG
jgi:hypothetical protein